MKRICAKCNKDLEKEMVYHIVDDQYICCRCYDFYHRPKYNELDFDNLRKVFRNEENQKAIECLKDVKKSILYSNIVFIDKKINLSQIGLLVEQYNKDKEINIRIIDDKIKELEGDNEM